LTKSKPTDIIGQTESKTKDKILSEIILTVEDVDPLELFGQNNSKLNLFRKAFPDVVVTSRGDQVKLVGKKKLAQSAKDKFEMMVRILKDQKTLSMDTLEDLLAGTHTF
jgi:phosphate starvation-inducible PhoH-like protein